MKYYQFTSAGSCVLMSLKKKNRPNHFQNAQVHKILQKYGRCILFGAKLWNEIPTTALKKMILTFAGQSQRLSHMCT